jgi:hypothetical protein
LKFLRKRENFLSCIFLLALQLCDGLICKLYASQFPINECHVVEVEVEVEVGGACWPQTKMQILLHTWMIFSSVCYNVGQQGLTLTLMEILPF